MSDRSPIKKKPRYVPPSVPRASGLSTPRATHNRSESLPRSGNALAPTQSTSRSNSVYPTPSHTLRRSSLTSEVFRQDTTPLPAANFQAAPQVDLQAIDDPDSDEPDHEMSDGSENEEGKLKSQEDEEEDNADDGGDDDDDPEILEEQTVPKFKSDAELDAYVLSLRASHAKQQEAITEVKTKKLTLSDPAPPHSVPRHSTLSQRPKTLPTRSKTTPASKKQTAPDVKVEEEPVRVKEELDEVSKEHLKTLIRGHSLKSLISLCGVKHAHEAAEFVPLYNDKKEPVWFDDNGSLVPHFELSFSENFDGWGKLKGWGEEFRKVAMNTERMDPADLPYLEQVEAKAFCDALITGGFATMKEAWRKNRDGKGEERRTRKKTGGRQLGRQKAKSIRRMNALKSSGLDVTEFGFLGDSGFQSAEGSDSDDKSLCVILDPLHRSAKVRELLGALDVKHESTKRPGGNKKYTKLEYKMVNTRVPGLKENKGHVPGWAVNTTWSSANTDLERSSRPFVDNQKTEMPQREVVDAFIHKYQPDPRTYVDSPVAGSQSLVLFDTPAVLPTGSLPCIQPETAPRLDGLAYSPAPDLAPAIVQAPPQLSFPAIPPNQMVDYGRLVQVATPYGPQAAYIDESGAKGYPVAVVKGLDGNSNGVQLEMYGRGIPGPNPPNNETVDFLGVLDPALAAESKKPSTRGRARQDKLATATRDAPSKLAPTTSKKANEPKKPAAPRGRSKGKGKKKGVEVETQVEEGEPGPSIAPTAIGTIKKLSIKVPGKK